MQYAVQVERVSHRYGQQIALNDVSLALPMGKTIGLVGPDGVGKSTLLGLISGTKKLQAGSLTVLGGDVADARFRKELSPRVAYMPQGLGRNLYRSLSVYDNIDFSARLFGVPAAERDARIQRLMKATALDPFPDRPAGKLSGGMKQKVSLCGALVHNPDLLILDEPTTGVDPLSRRQFWALVESLRAERPHMTVLVATAYMEEAERFEHLVAMNAGQVLVFDRTENVLARTPQHTLEAAYIRFAGFTFGVARDNFSFMPSTFYGTGHWSSFANGAFQLAYTAVLGGGLSATLAIQDASYTQSGGVVAGATAIQNSYDRLPQLNARLDWDQAWGTVSVMGAMNQLHAVTSATSTAYDQTKMGWALGAGVKMNLPMLAAGDALWLNGGYANGMTEYTVNWISFKSSDIARNVGGYVQNATSFATTANGIETFRSWNIAALFTHFWSPMWRHSFLATYGAVNAPASVNNLAWGTTAGGQADAKVWNIGTQLAFIPVNNFEIGVDVLYARVKYSGSITPAVNTSQGNWTGRLRAERTF